MKSIPTKFISRSDAELISADPQHFIKAKVIPADKRVVILSFISPDGFGGSEVRPVKLDGYWHKVLEQRFHDIDPSNCSSAFLDQYIPFSPKQAEEVIEFLLQVEEEADEVWTHCEAGISRSAGAAKYIAYAYNSYFPETYSLYNKHVYSLLVKAHNTRAYENRPFPGQRFHV